MVLISFREFSRIKKNSDNFLKSQSNTGDNSKGHGMEIEEPGQLPNSEIPKQDVYQEEYAKSILKDTNNSEKNSVSLCVNGNETSEKPEPIKNTITHLEDPCRKWYFIGIPKCMEKN